MLRVFFIIILTCLFQNKKAIQKEMQGNRERNMKKETTNERKLEETGREVFIRCGDAQRKIL